MTEQNNQNNVKPEVKFTHGGKIGFVSLVWIELRYFFPHIKYISFGIGISLAAYLSYLFELYTIATYVFPVGLIMITWHNFEILTIVRKIQQRTEDERRIL